MKCYLYSSCTPSLNFADAPWDSQANENPERPTAFRTWKRTPERLSRTVLPPGNSFVRHAAWDAQTSTLSIRKGPYAPDPNHVPPVDWPSEVELLTLNRRVRCGYKESMDFKFTPRNLVPRTHVFAGWGRTDVPSDRLSTVSWLTSGYGVQDMERLLHSRGVFAAVEVHRHGEEDVASRRYKARAWVPRQTYNPNGNSVFGVDSYPTWQGAEFYWEYEGSEG